MGVLYERGGPLWAPTNNTNATSATLPSRIPRVTALPSIGNGLIKTGADGSYTAKTITLLPFGVGIATNTFTMALFGWRSTTGAFGGTENLKLWIPSLLAKFTVTLGTSTGVAASDLGATQLFATTITAAFWPTGDPSLTPPTALDWFILSPGSNDLAMVRAGVMGFPYIEACYATGSSATSCNALYSLL